MHWIRGFFIFAGLVASLLAVGFLFDQSWATWIWPFFSYRMSQWFIASILLAVATPVLLIGISGEWAAVRGGALNLGVMFAIMAIYTLMTSNSVGVTIFGAVAAGSALFQFGLFFGTRGLTFNDTRPIPRPVFWSFWVFSVVLIVVGGALIGGVKNVLPWSVSRDLSVMYGAVFLGAAIFFIYGIRANVWGAARGPLAGFLAYDLVLIGPFVLLYPQVADRFHTSLIIYIVVVVYSGLLAAYYLVKGPGAAAMTAR